MNSPKFNQSIHPNKCLFYEDVKQIAKVYSVNTVAMRIRQSFSSPKFPALQYTSRNYIHATKTPKLQYNNIICWSRERRDARDQ